MNSPTQGTPGPPPADAPSKKREGRLQAVRRGLRTAFLHNAALKFVALVLSITLFILVNTSRDAVIGVNVGVSYTMPEDRILVSERVDQVRVTIKGSWRRVKRFDGRELNRIHVDLRDVRGSEYRFSPEDIRLPPGLTLLSIEPPSIELDFEPAAEKIVRVNVPTSGRPARGYRVERVVIKPSQITVRGARSVVTGLSGISTRELDLTGKQTSFTEVLPLVPPEPPPILQLIDSKTVEVEVTLTEEMTTRRVKDVDVQIRPGPGLSGPVPDQFTIEPAQVDVVLHGPHLAVEELGSDLVAYVEVHPGDVADRAPRQAKVQIQAPPKGVGIEVVPYTVTLRPQRSQ